VKAVIKLALEGPLELGMIEVARVDVKDIGVHRHGRVLKMNGNFDAVSLSMRSKGEQGMIVEA